MKLKILNHIIDPSDILAVSDVIIYHESDDDKYTSYCITITLGSLNGVCELFVPVFCKQGEIDALHSDIIEKWEYHKNLSGVHNLTKDAVLFGSYKSSIIKIR